MSRNAGRNFLRSSDSQSLLGRLIQPAVFRSGEYKMERFIRRAAIGAIAGIVASAPLIPALGHIFAVLLLGALLGVGYAVLTGPTPGAYLDNMFTAGANGVPLWAVVSVIALPLLSGQMPEWSAEQIRSHFPVLVGWVLYGITL